MYLYINYSKSSLKDQFELDSSPLFELNSIRNDQFTGNKIIDKMTKKTYSFSLFFSKRMHHKVTTRMNFILVILQKK